MKGKKQRWPRTLRRCAAATILLLGIAAIATKYWVAPAMVRWRLRRVCSRYWDGPLRIRQVDFSFIDRNRGRIRLRDLELLDRQGRLHASAETVKLGFRNFASIRPVLTDVAVHGLELRVHRASGKLILPLRHPRESGTRKTGDLQSLEIPTASLTVYDDGVPGRRLDALQFTAARKGMSYSIKLHTLAAKTTQAVSFVGHLPLDASGPVLENLKGRGLLLLGDVDARKDPLTHEFFAFLNSTAPKSATTSNIEAVFTLRGPVVTLQRAVLADKLTAMEVERGGTINLQTRQLDLYLITLELRGISKLMAHIPLVKLTTSLSNKLTRVHVTGTWDDKKFRKEPVKDLSAATLEFLQESIRTGGQVEPGMHGAFLKLFESLRSRRSEKHPPDTKPTAGS